MTASTFEVRVPTWRRPELLRRALESLLAQDYPLWKALVIDDSPAREGKPVVESLADSRICYHANVRKLGLVRNLAKAFSSAPLLGQTDFCCVLEDDNYLKPRFLSRASGHLSNPEVHVFHSNAQVAQLHSSGREIIEDRDTMSAIYGDEVRLIPYEERLVNLVTGNPVVANSCLAWKMHSGIDLEIAREPYNQIVQEKMRGVATRHPYLYDPTPELIWTNFPDRVAKRAGKIAKTWHDRRWHRSEITMMRFGMDEIRRHGWRGRLAGNSDAALAATGLIRELWNVAPPRRFQLLKNCLLARLMPRPEFKVEPCAPRK